MLCPKLIIFLILYYKSLRAKALRALTQLIKASFDLKSKVVNFRFDYLAAHYYTATPQELMVILQDFSER